MALATMLGQAVLIAVLLGAVFGRIDKVEPLLERPTRAVSLLLLLNVSCFWFGCNNAAKELVKERVIYSRERDFNLRIDGYLASKFAVLTFIALIQTSVLFGIVKCWCDPPGPVLDQWGILATLALAGTALGLLMSAAAKTEEVAAALVPLGVLPQIILAGVIAPLSGPAEWVAEGFVSTYWGARVLKSLLPDDYLQVLGVHDSTYAGPVLLIAGHVVVVAALTGLALWRRDQGRSKA